MWDACKCIGIFPAAMIVCGYTGSMNRPGKSALTTVIDLLLARQKRLEREIAKLRRTIAQTKGVGKRKFVADAAARPRKRRK
jgi:hypothetical protein